jgi:hypothetical protein
MNAIFKKTLGQYKKISELDPVLLKELGVEYDGIRKGVKEKLFGYRNVYWSLLFEHLDAISSRLTSKHKKDLLNKLSANALDFTYLNAIYIISYAVEMGNELIEQSLIDVFQSLTSPDSISRYYKSNQHVYRDDWRYNKEQFKASKFALDYRFISSSWSNFSSNSWEKGLNESARSFCDDLMVAFNLLGYGRINKSLAYDSFSYGDTLFIKGETVDGKMIELVKIKFYKNGNRHISFDQSAMLRLNVTVSRLLGWVRSKEEYANETETTSTVEDSVWSISDRMKVQASNILMLTDRMAA